MPSLARNNHNRGVWEEEIYLIYKLMSLAREELDGLIKLGESREALMSGESKQTASLTESTNFKKKTRVI